MKKFYPILLSLLLVSPILNSQSFEWLQTVDVDYEFNPGMIQYTTYANPQGGCYFYGIQEHEIFYNQAMGSQFLKKYSAQGDEIWSRTIQGQSSAGGASCYDNGDVYIFGQMYTNLDFWGQGSLVKTGIGTDGFLAKVSSEGELDWCINLTSLPMGEGTVSALEFDYMGWPYVAYSNWMNSYVLIFNPEGEYQQSIIQENVRLISGLDFDYEGNLFTTGSCAGYNSTFGGISYPAPFDYTTYLVKYNSLFQPLWVKYIEDITCTFPQVKVDNSGWVYFAGPLMSETMFDTIPINGPEWVYDFFLARLSPVGQYEWVIECPEVMTGDATVGNLHYLDMDPDGNALLTGFARGILDWGNGVISDVTANYQDIIVWSYAQDGQVNWIKTAGGEGYELSHSISAGTDGSAYLAGVISGTVVFDSITHESTDFADPFLAKLDLDIISGSAEILIQEDLLVYPNPATDRVFINPEAGYSEFRLYNITGQIVLRGALSGLKPAISLVELPAGIYLLNLAGKDGAIANARVVIE